MVGEPHEMKENYTIIRHAKFIFISITNLVEKPFSQNWFISKDGWTILQSLLEQNFEINFWRQRNNNELLDEKKNADDNLGSTFIFASINANLLPVNSTYRIRWVNFLNIFNYRGGHIAGPISTNLISANC